MQDFTETVGVSRIDGREELPLGRLRGLLGMGEDLASRHGQLDQVATAVLDLRTARDDASALERVEERDHRGAVDAEQLRDMLL